MPENLSLILIALIYGANYSIIKELLDGTFGIDAMELVFLRVFGATILIAILYFYFLKDKTPKFTEIKKDLWKLSLAGILGICFSMPAFFEGLRIIGAINAAVIHLTTPLFILLFSILFKQEESTPKKAIGVFTGFFGAYLLITRMNHIHFEGLWGNLLVLSSAITWALYIVLLNSLNKKYKEKFDPKYSYLSVFCWSFIFGTTALAIGLSIFYKAFYDQSFFHELVFGTQWSQLGWANWAFLAFIIVIATFLSNLLKNFSLRKVTPTKNGIFTYVQVIFTALIAFWGFNNNAWDFFSQVGFYSSTLIIGGLYFVSFPGPLPKS